MLWIKHCHISKNVWRFAMTILGFCALTVFLLSNTNTRCTKQQGMTLWHTHKQAQTGYMQGNVVGEGYSETHIIKRLAGKNHRRLTGDILLRWHNKCDMIAAVWQSWRVGKIQQPLYCSAENDLSMPANCIHADVKLRTNMRHTYRMYSFTLWARIRNDTWNATRKQRQTAHSLDRWSFSNMLNFYEYMTFTVCDISRINNKAGNIAIKYFYSNPTLL